MILGKMDLLDEADLDWPRLSMSRFELKPGIDSFKSPENKLMQSD
jgi:hypothetical protein